MKLNRLWHRYILRHTMTYYPPLVPDRVMRREDGKPLINVFEQSTFQYPMEHWRCSCGQAWV